MWAIICEFLTFSRQLFEVHELNDVYPSDWESVVIIYKKSPTNMLWSAEFLLMSQHGGYEGRDWLAIKQTLS